MNVPAWTILRRTGSAALQTVLLAVAGGCAARMPIDATDYQLHLELDPPQHRLAGQAEVRVVAPMRPPRARLAGVEVAFALHPDLEVSRISADPVEVRGWRAEPDASTNGPAPTRYRIKLDRWAETFTLTFHYAGRLEQDVQAGEKRGEIHNFTVNAHVGEDGVYLGGDGDWYPRPHEKASAEVDDGLARYAVEVAPVEGFVFVAGADGRAAPQPGAALSAGSPFPQTDMAVVGGRYRVWSRDVEGVRFSMLLHAASADDTTLERRADLFVGAAIDYLQRYQPLVGPYPFDEFIIVENFFSSGFAFPTFTLLGPMVIAMEDRALRHGYLDHEMLHSWWGNALYVDPDDGNWCEALASFGANLHGYVLDGDLEGARKHRRDICNSLSRLPAAKDKPLDTFGRPGGANRTIGYQKGSLVFHMLARQMGEGRFWAAMRALTAERIGQFVGWDAIQETCERELGRDLDNFFGQWVHQGGTPRFTLAQAEPGDTPDSVRLEIQQSEPALGTELPLRIRPAHGDPFDILAPVSGTTTRITLDAVDLPADIELDPDFHVARKLAPEEIMPTLAGIYRGDTCLVVVADDELGGGYKLFADDVHKKRKGETRTVSADTVTAEDLAGATLVIVGDAVRAPVVQDLLARSECPATWTDEGFSVDGTDFHADGHAVLGTIRHPDQPERTITVYYGNTPAALSNAGILWFYGNSLLVFQTPTGPGTVPGTGYAAVVKRMDFERSHRIHVNGPTAAR